MSVELFNFDKIDRNSVEIVLKGKKHKINEPTVGEYAKISKLDFKDGNNDSLYELARIIAPTVDIEELTIETRDLFFVLCFKVISGEYGEEKRKKWKLEELLLE